MTTTEGPRVAAQRAYYEAIEATNRANAAAEAQLSKVKAVERQLAYDRSVLAELVDAADRAARDEDFAHSYAQEVQS